MTEIAPKVYAVESKFKSPKAATSVPAVMVSTESVIPRVGLIRRKRTPSNKLAIGTQRRIALYIGMFIPFRANRAEINEP